MRVRGLKQLDHAIHHRTNIVAPHAGAWIETCTCHAERRALRVAPHAGAWIETA